MRDLLVAGEISNFKHHHSGHMYFTLKDEKSSLRCVFFRRENSRCLFTPAGGMAVIAHGNISVYEPDGAYQLYVSELEPAGSGSLYLAFEQLKQKLAAEGLFAEERKKKLPFLPRKIAVITSPTGAAIEDILTTAKRRFPHVEFLVVESLVQGPGASANLASALDLVNKRKDLDLIILARGGGSLEDLWAFNEEVVARAIFRSRLPVISAVGHETDFTIADFVADYRAATPTAASVAALPDLMELTADLIRLRENTAQALNRRMQKERQRIDYTLSDRFYRQPQLRLKRSRENLERTDMNLKKEMVRKLQLKGSRLSALNDQLESYSPLKVMSRGYSYCRDEQGEIIRSVKSVRVGSLLSLTFKDGSARCRVEKIEEGACIE